MDALYAVHNDMRGHTGDTMSTGSSCAYSTSNKQKQVSQSLTETELIGVYNMMPQKIWVGNIMQVQGQDVKQIKLMLDNMSSILLDHNGKVLSSKQTKHIDIYFHIKEKADMNEIDIAHCPTEDMGADFFTKPVQGNLFQKLHDQNMVLGRTSQYHSNHRSVLGQDVLSA